MTKQGIHKIRAMHGWYIIYRSLAITLFAMAFSVAVETILLYGFNVFDHSLFIIFLITLSGLFWYYKPWVLKDTIITGFLDQKFAGLEESASLLLKPNEELNLLEQLQVAKTNEAMQNVPVQQWRFFKNSLIATVLLAMVLSVNLYLGNGHLFRHSVTFNDVQWVSPVKMAKPEKILPQISSVNITVTPPAYTSKPMREQDRFTLEVEEGAAVSWSITTNIAVKKAILVFNDKEVYALKSNNNIRWTSRKIIDKPGFYQVNIDGKLSDLYQIRVVKDLPPLVRIKTPKQYTYIDAGEAQQVNINTVVNDDYGVTGAMIFATVAKGSGEAVKFKEYKLTFATAFGGHQPQYNLQKLIKLPSLNMEPGDELYFYVQATDTHRQQSRTDVYTVSIQDTAQLLSMDGMLTGVNQKPEFFRSERQIILDTEKLLKDKDSITIEQFKNRSNDLGIDQKILRLRYGKFLGEESEEGGDDLRGEDAVSDINNFGNAAVILDKYTDKHDNAEDATFFDPELKKQLKATLTEMWKAELQLRLYKPQAALPFEYKSLRLLKDLQQKSRVFVAKTTYKTPPLKPEKRLSGDLDKIVEPLNKQEIKPGADPFEALKKAATILSQLKNKQVLAPADIKVLQLAGQQLSQRASAQPGTYLAAFSAMRRILSAQNTVNSNDVALVEKAIQKTLAQAAKIPGAAQSPVDMGLSQQYYNHLNHTNR